MSPLSLIELDEVLAAIWSDHCIHKFDDVLVGDDEVFLCSKGTVIGSTSFEMLIKLGADA